MGMGQSGGGGSRGRIAHGSMSEINVTPLVDVMLVLLVIFMVAASVETARMSKEAETLRQAVTEEAASKQETGEMQVPVDLPKVKADTLPASGKKGKPVVSIDGDKKLFLDKDLLINCAGKSVDACLDGFEAAIQKHPKGKGLREAHLRADRKLDYGLVLALMSRMRRVGIEHFGLVSQEPLN